MKKLVFTLLIAAAVLFSFAACGNSASIPGVSTAKAEDRYYEYELLDDGTAEISGYTGSVANLEVSSTIYGYTVTSIGRRAFAECTSLTNIVIPSTVTSIGGHAFDGCSNLTNIAIPNSVTSISNGAFINCTNLTGVTIPDSVTSIGVEAFSNCKNLTSITIPKGVTSISNTTFDGCSKLQSMTIPDSVASIGSSAFSGCEKLVDITIPDSVEEIGSDAFKNTVWYEKLYESQPDGIVYVGKVAYEYKGDMPANTSITLEDGTKGIASNAFADCENLVGVNIPNSIINIGYDAFSDCTSLTSITIPDSVTKIGGGAFSGCTGLTSVDIPDSITNISGSTFSDTPWYENQYESQPDGVVYIGSIAFNYKGDVPENASITFKDGTTVIADGILEECDNLVSVTIPDSVVGIGEDTFKGCRYITAIYGTAGSAAETFANENGFTFVAQ